MPDEQPLRDPAGVVVAGYLLAALCVLLPLAMIGAAFAGAVLARRQRPWAGAGVIALGLLCTGLGVILLR